MKRHNIGLIFNVRQRTIVREEDLRIYDDNDDFLPAEVAGEIDRGATWALYSLAGAAMIFFIWALSRALDMYFGQ